jgi:hypothetical protein
MYDESEVGEDGEDDGEVSEVEGWDEILLKDEDDFEVDTDAD